MKAIGYVRMSTDEQASDGVSLEAQRKRIEGYCVAKDWTLVDVKQDPGCSAKNMKRLGLQEILSQLRDVDAVIVYKLDRLTRSVSDLNIMLERFKKCHVSLVSLSESLDATTATGELMLNLLISVSHGSARL